MPVYWDDEPQPSRQSRAARQRGPRHGRGRQAAAAVVVLIMVAISVRLALIALVEAPAAPGAITLVPRPSETLAPAPVAEAEAAPSEAPSQATVFPSPTVPLRTFRLAVEQALYDAFLRPLEALDRAHEDVIVLPYAPGATPEDLLTQRLADGVVFWTIDPLAYGIPLAEIPYALVTHPQNERDGFSQSQLGAIVDGLDETYTFVVPGDDRLVRAFLGRDHWSLRVVRVGAWAEAVSYVASHAEAMAVVPWEEVDQRVRLVAVDGRRADPTDTVSYPFCHRIWLLESSAMLMPDAALGDLQRELAYETSPSVRLVAVGDLMLGGYCGEQMAEKGVLYPFGDPALSALLADADIALGNLASPISERGELMEGLTVYRADPMAAQALAEVGFDLMSVANEHVPAFGGEALLDTLDALRETGIEPAGAGVNRDEAYAPVVIERNGLQVAFLAFSEVGPDVLAATADAAGVAWLHDSRALRAVAEASRRADLVVVSCHWGELHASEVTEAQVAAAEALLGAGADLIIGHHSHTVQAISYGEQGVVAYSLGDLVYHPWSSASSADGLVLVATLGGGGVRAVELVPFRVEECRPRLLQDEAADVVLGRASALPTPSGGP